MATRTLIGNDISNTLRATKTKVRFWFDRWDSWHIYGEDGGDYIVGGEKSDRLYGGDGGDTIHGKGGNDFIEGDRYGEFGKDFLYGGDGNDNLYGGAGDDELYGGKHHDFLSGGGGADRLEGGSGNDYYVAYSDSAAFEDTIIEDIYGGSDTLETNVTVVLPSEVENLVLKWTAWTGATGVGNDGHNTIEGWHFNDYLYGKDGVDRINGGLGDDYISGGDDFDILNGGQGSDTLIGGEAGDWLTGYGEGTNERDTMTGGDGADIFYLAHGSGYTNISYMDAGFATITDFSRVEGDKIVLAGNESTYTREIVGSDTHIRRWDNLIAVVENTASMNFSMTGDVTYYA